MTVNVLGDLHWEEPRQGRPPGWELNQVTVGDLAGTKALGASLYELLPGKVTWPYHYHEGEEELLIVLSGRPTLREPAGERELAAGDCILFPLGPEGAHQLRNDTDEPARLLIASDNADVGWVVYPDSRKVGVWGKGGGMRLSMDATMDYWEGEAD